MCGVTLKECERKKHLNDEKPKSRGVRRDSGEDSHRMRVRIARKREHQLSKDRFLTNTTNKKRAIAAAVIKNGPVEYHNRERGKGEGGE